MTRPDPAAICAGAAGAVWTTALIYAGWPFPAGTLAAVIHLWHVPEEDNSDIEALMRATREEMPDRVPDDWVKEFGL